MLTLNLALYPQGSGIGRRAILTGSIWTTEDGKTHAYSILNEDKGTIHEGSIPKTQSGHRNPETLLLNIMKDIQSK